MLHQFGPETAEELKRSYSGVIQAFRPGRALCLSCDPCWKSTCFLLHHQFFALCLYLSSLRKAMALQYIALNYKGSVPVGLLGRAWAAGSRGSFCRQQLHALAGWLELPWTGRRNPWQRWRKGKGYKERSSTGNANMRGCEESVMFGAPVTCINFFHSY